MSGHVFLNLLNRLGKRDKMRGLPSILSLFRNEFNNTGAQMLDPIYHMTLKLFWNHIFGVKTFGFAICMTLKASVHNISRKSVNH